MSTSYLECDHHWREQFSELFKEVYWCCDFCELRTWRAPWSYCELVGSIGLESMHRSNVELFVKNGMPIPGKREFLAGGGLFTMQPSQYILALQAGVQFAPVPVQLTQPPKPRFG